MVFGAAALALFSCQPEQNPGNDKTPDSPENPSKDGITEIYIYGPATSTGTDLENMEAFTSLGGGLFNWTGTLKADATFRFPLQKTSEWPSLMPDEDGSLLLGESEDDLLVYTLSVGGEYEIIIDTRDKDNLIYTIDLVKADMSGLEINELYIIGDATPTGWAIDTMEQFTEENGVFTWEGPLVAEKRFRFPLQKEPDTWWPCLMAGPDGKILLGTKDADEVNTPVSESGIYVITIDTRNREDITYTCELKQSGLPDVEITELYLLGPAANGWDILSMPEFENNGGIFTWTGSLKGNEQFRMLTQKADNMWFPGIMINLETGKPQYVTNADFGDGSSWDHFSVAADGTYTITVDARKWNAITVDIK